jgi:hypothetical protein
MESKNKILKTTLIIGFVTVLITSLFFYTKSNSSEKIPEKVTPQSPPKEVAIIPETIPEVITETELNDFFQDFIKAFNTNKVNEINRFIDEKDGLVEFVYDGYYPLIIFSNKMDYIEWFETKIHKNVFSEKFPEYLGDTQFEKTGFFYEKYQKKFKLKDFDNSYVNYSDTIFKSHHVLEEKCNYRALAMDVEGKRIYSFYFSVTKEKKKLVGLSYDYTKDITYSDPKKDFIPFDTKEDIERFITEKQKFCDVGNKSYLDFEKKEFTYYDYPENPYVFVNFQIGEAKVESKKIKTREIIFYSGAATNEKYANDFTMTLTNKGTFIVPPMGARSDYNYSVCE